MFKIPKLSKSTSTIKKGQSGEKIAEMFLRGKGLKLVEKNFRAKTGEIDLIMKDKGDLVFIEVRIRSNPNFASGAESVTKSKQRKIINTANIYLQKHIKEFQNGARFDVISISAKNDCNQPEIDWIPNAFNAYY